MFYYSGEGGVSARGREGEWEGFSGFFPSYAVHVSYRNNDKNNTILLKYTNHP